MPKLRPMTGEDQSPKVSIPPPLKPAATFVLPKQDSIEKMVKTHTTPVLPDKPAVTENQISGRIQELINDLGTLPKTNAIILAIGKLNGAIRRLQL